MLAAPRLPRLLCGWRCRRAECESSYRDLATKRHKIHKSFSHSPPRKGGCAERSGGADGGGQAGIPLISPNFYLGFALSGSRFAPPVLCETSIRGLNLSDLNPDFPQLLVGNRRG